MKQLKLITCLLLLSSTSFKSNACSFWPTGEDIRISLFSSNVADGMDMEYLFYSTHFFNDYSQKELRGPNENLAEWYAYFGGKVDKESIDELIYKLPYDGPSGPLFKNKLYRYFKEGADKEVMNYILFSKKVEILLNIDIWSDVELNVPQCEWALSKAVEQSKASKTDMLKLRYAYQAIVIAYYLADTKRLDEVYNNLVLPLNSNSVIAVWCTFYKSNMIVNQAERFKQLALVFEKSRSKNVYIFQHFPTDPEVVSQILKRCQTPEEEAAVYCVLAFKNPARAMDQIKKIASLNPRTNLLDILLVREINKMEDWYYTDRYTGFGSAIESNSLYSDEAKRNFRFFDEKNFESDKRYLVDVMGETEKLMAKHKELNKPLWYTSLAYMGYMLDNQQRTNTYLKLATNSQPDRLVQGQLKTIELLNLVKYERDWDEKFQANLLERLNGLNDFKDELYNYDRLTGQIMLAISRKYLEEDNIVLAALFETKVTGETYEQYHDWSSDGYQGFDLLNENGNSQDLDAFFELWNNPNKTDMEKHLFDGLEEWRWRYTDLWGTTYLREDKLESALQIYETIPDSVWEVTNRDFHYYYAQELDANPFDTRFTSSGFDDDRSKTYTKPEFVKELIRLKKQVLVSSKNRAYHYMLLGNAYFNMTADGNSWYYTEYAWTTNDYMRTSGQNPDHYTAERALHYYKLAEKESKNEAFSAFCYRLQYKCLALRNTTYEEYKKCIRDFDRNFQTKYPDHAENLEGCDQFDDYFMKWREA